MPIYVYRCDCGERFERLVGLDAPGPACPACGGTPQKIPAGPSLLGQAGTGLAKEQMPQTWRGTYSGDREYVTGLRRQWEQRQRLEAKHPELAGDQRPIIAHEGRFHGAPLRAGDQVPAPGHGHGHAPEEPSDGGAGKTSARPPS